MEGAKMESKMLRVVHYLNQFFGGIGGEDKAHIEPQVSEGPIGPGRGIQNALGDQGEVVATVICGDNYFAENIEEATEEVTRLLSPYQPDVVIAGPAFDAGRYGIACGAVCQAVKNQLGIPAVTGMYKENAGLDLFRKDVYIVGTTDSVRGMTAAISKMVSMARRLATNQEIGRPSEEGYFPRGLLVNEISDQTGAERVIAMLLKKLHGQPFESEVSRPHYDRVKPAPRIRDIHKATIALVTDGGLVPKGNPDRIEIRTATRFGKYALKGIDTLNPEDYEVAHAGYDSVFVRQDPNRLVPVDVMRDLEKEGIIGKLHEKFYSTTGVANIVETMRKIGQAMAEELKAEGISGVILTST
jgi:glycine reductase